MGEDFLKHKMSKIQLIKFDITPSSGVPIYRQIMQQIRRMIASSHLNPGDTLPSIRKLASELVINQMTISKAYSLLEVEGLLERKRGIGMLVAHSQQQSLSLNKRLNLLKPSINTLINESQQLDISKTELINTIDQLME
jgi:GntR family transcriptional regulator